jgi:hypothetical protein
MQTIYIQKLIVCIYIQVGGVFSKVKTYGL